MRVRNVLLSSPLADTLQDRLGPVLEGQDHCLSLIAWKDDTLYVWNRQKAAMLVVTPSSETVQTLVLVSCPQHDVEAVEINRTGTWAAVWGSQGVTVIQIPRRSRKEELVVTSLTVVRKEQQVQRVCWHPGSTEDTHLTVLTRDARLALYNVGDGVGEVRGLSLGSRGKVAAALGEVAVDFAFGPAGVEGQWPLFVLFGNCDVFCVSAGISYEWGVEGPLVVRPAREDNYCGEACSIIAVGGVLCIATMGGRLYHSVVLGGENTSLHMYEQVELELGQVPSEAGSDVFACPVRLTGGTWCSGYLASHRAGLHRVELPMVSLLQEEGLDLSECGSVVEHLVCTRASPSLPPAPVLGCCVARPPTTVLCLLSDHSMSCLPCAPLPPCVPLLTTSSPSSPPGLPSPLDSQISSILGRSSTQPILRSGAGPDTRLQPAEALEMLTGATTTLRREYMARIHIAREELANTSHKLRERKAGQEDSLTLLEEERAQLRDAAEALSERYEDIRDRGQELGERVEAVLAKLQAKVPQLSDKELAMAREVTGLERRVDSLQGGIRQLREKEKYQRYQVESSSWNKRELSKTQLDNFKEVLQNDSKTIADLVDKVNMAKKKLGL